MANAMLAGFPWLAAILAYPADVRTDTGAQLHISCKDHASAFILHGDSSTLGVRESSYTVVGGTGPFTITSSRGEVSEDSSLTGPLASEELIVLTVTDAKGATSACSTRLEFDESPALLELDDGTRDEQRSDSKNVTLEARLAPRLSSSWYSFLEDEALDFHMNVRVTETSKDTSERLHLSGLAVILDGHSFVVELVEQAKRPEGVCLEQTNPCLANGVVRILVDGEESLQLLAPTNDTLLSGGIKISSSNLPTECRRPREPRLWLKKSRWSTPYVHDGAFEAWVAAFDDVVSPYWCRKFVAEHSLFSVQSNHAIFRISIPSLTVRLSVNLYDSQRYDNSSEQNNFISESLRMDLGIAGMSGQSNSNVAHLLNVPLSMIDTEEREITFGESGSISRDVLVHRMDSALGTGATRNPELA